ncbi:MAG: cytochrome P450 [Gammaproteobacteria bacterium]
MTDDRVTIDVDHNGPEFAADPHGLLRRMRERCPVAWSTAQGGYWAVTGYDALARIAQDDATFSSRRVDDTNAVVITGSRGAVQVPIELDPPESTRYRAIVNPISSPRAVEKLKPRFAHWAAYFIDRIIERGEGDLVLDFASPVPAAVTIEWLGFPSQDWQRYAEPMHNITTFPPGSPEFAKAGADMAWIYEQIVRFAHERRAEPRDDVMTYFVQQRIDGRPLTDEEMVSIISLLIVGGVDTTTSLTGQTLLYLHRHPDLRRRLIEEPALLQSATEEFLRYFAPVTGLARRATADAEVGGQCIRKGERIWLSWAAANRDPTKFTEPDRFDPERFPNLHTTFGLGTHRCAGSTIARFEFQEMVRQVLARMPDYVVDESSVSFYPSQGVNTGVARLPVKFKPGPRLLAG